MASQPVIEAAARESRANAREDMAVLTAGAREKVDSTIADLQAVGKKILHPLDKAKKEEADAVAERQKKEARDKRDEIRSIAAQQAATERAAARGMVAKGVAETGGARYPVLVTDHPPPSNATQTQEAPDSAGHAGGQPRTSTSRDSSISDSEHGQPSASRKRLQDHFATDQSHNLDLRAAEETTEAPPPVSPPSRKDGNGRPEGHHKNVEEGVEDADFYPPTRVVQT